MAYQEQNAPNPPTRAETHFTTVAAGFSKPSAWRLASHAVFVLAAIPEREDQHDCLTAEQQHVVKTLARQEVLFWVAVRVAMRIMPPDFQKGNDVGAVDCPFFKRVVFAVEHPKKKL